MSATASIPEIEMGSCRVRLLILADINTGREQVICLPNTLELTPSISYDPLGIIANRAARWEKYKKKQNTRHAPIP